MIRETTAGNDGRHGGGSSAGPEQPMGPVDVLAGARTAATRGQQLLGELDPSCLAMCGLCAGDPCRVSLGDVILADRRCMLWEAVDGGLVAMTGSALRLTDAGREKVLEEQLMHPDGPPADPPLRVHVGAIAALNEAVQDPGVWDELQRSMHIRFGLEREGAAMGDLASRFQRRAVLVKAVSDHAGLDKDDSFREFACRASAAVLFAFLQRHVAETPRRSREPAHEGNVSAAWFEAPRAQAPRAEARGGSAPRGTDARRRARRLGPARHRRASKSEAARPRAAPTRGQQRGARPPRSSSPMRTRTRSSGSRSAASG